MAACSKCGGSHMAVLAIGASKLETGCRCSAFGNFGSRCTTHSSFQICGIRIEIAVFMIKSLELSCSVSRFPCVLRCRAAASLIPMLPLRVMIRVTARRTPTSSWGRYWSRCRERCCAQRRPALARRASPSALHGAQRPAPSASVSSTRRAFAVAGLHCAHAQLHAVCLWHASASIVQQAMHS